MESAEIQALWGQYRRARGRGRAALLQALTQAYLPLVVLLATALHGKSNLPPQVDRDDLVQDGVFGLREAIAKYDPARACSFRTFAKKRIIGAMIDGIRDLDAVPRLERQRHRLVAATLERERLAAGRDLNAEELLAALRERMAGGDPAEVVRTAESARLHETIAETDLTALSRDEDHPLGLSDRSGPADPGERNIHRREVFAAMCRGMTRTERTVLRLYYYEGMKMAEVGAALGFCESRASQIHTALLKRLAAVPGLREMLLSTTF